ncbi:hypothetical protein Ahy_B03g065471 isoform B [Arachis hypogaea]|nr:hypothetical protein Ahy_B03g065471 isoform B [Arachis hypogaea]
MMKTPMRSMLRIATIVVLLKMMMRRSLYQRCQSRQRCAMFCLLPHLISALSYVPSHYHALDLDAMHEKSPFFNTGKDDYSGVEFRVSHKFKSTDAVMQGVKNYNICRRAKYQVVESDRLKYHVHCCQSAIGSPWSLRVALR